MLKLLERAGIRKSPQTCVTQNIKTKDERRISALNPIFTKAKGALMLPHIVSISKKFSKLCIRILHFESENPHKLISTYWILKSWTPYTNLCSCHWGAEPSLRRKATMPFRCSMFSSWFPTSNPNYKLFLTTSAKVKSSKNQSSDKELTVCLACTVIHVANERQYVFHSFQFSKFHSLESQSRGDWLPLVVWALTTSLKQKKSPMNSTLRH